MTDKEWKEAVIKREFYQDQITRRAYVAECYFDENGVNQYVCAHHLHSKAARPDLRHDLNNGITVSLTTHNEIHQGKHEKRLDEIKGTEFVRCQDN